VHLVEVYLHSYFSGKSSLHLQTLSLLLTPWTDVLAFYLTLFHSGVLSSTKSKITNRSFPLRAMFRLPLYKRSFASWVGQQLFRDSCLRSHAEAHVVAQDLQASCGKFKRLTLELHVILNHVNCVRIRSRWPWVRVGLLSSILWELWSSYFAVHQCILQ